MIIHIVFKNSEDYVKITGFISLEKGMSIMDSHSYYHEYEQNDRRWSDSSRSGRYSYSYDSAGSEAVDFSLFEGNQKNFSTTVV